MFNSVLGEKDYLAGKCSPKPRYGPGFLENASQEKLSAVERLKPFLT